MRIPLWYAAVAGLMSLTVIGSAQAETTGYFHVEKRDGRWWLITPKGEPFLSKGVCAVRYAPDPILGTGPSLYGEANAKKYPSVKAWAEAKTSQLLAWDFNTLGAWYDEGMVFGKGDRLARTPILNIAADYARKHIEAGGGKKSAWEMGVFPDVFSPDFETFARERAHKVCTPQAQDSNILGWFIDNELRWGPDWRSQDELLVTFLNSSKEAPGRHAAIGMLQKRYKDIVAFNEVWKTGAASWAELVQGGEIKSPFPHREKSKQNEEIERVGDDSAGRRKLYVADCDAFLGLLAEQYFAVTQKAVREAAPHHMVFGCRFAYTPAKPVLEAAARHVDVISFNSYSTDPSGITENYATYGRPLIVGEFAFRAEDSGLPNTKGAGPKVANQKERAAAYEKYVRALVSNPSVVGYHWFKHVDEPAEGRFDGENSNYGLLKINDEPYEGFVEKVKECNGKADTWHANAPVTGRK
ncbi:agarase [Terrimicrobium sacchariphilum]|uniref:Agarase n=1 Tax=Terrimicrobium sacchariphilum TaxID=690879 RepID=A0A146G8G1_TERSA|nr:hypothetical protein [Terrimicrobium sacchariphilum]GAT33593.1 agarase [Terrimicrobium sacchariphilum]